MARSIFIIFLFLSLPLYASDSSGNITNDDEIRDKLIRESIEVYSGACPCPYTLDRAGRKCGKRSAYSKPDGESPLCYRKDISDEMVKRDKGD